jgi:calcium-dependent protein kinase
MAFSMFDKDGSGFISADEVKSVLGVGKNVDEKLWLDIVKEVDANGDGEISFSEFKIMMEKLLLE